MNDMPVLSERERPPLSAQETERLAKVRAELVKFLMAANLNWPDHQIDAKTVLSAQAWNEIPVEALPAACLEARRTTERGVPMDSEVIRAHRRLTNAQPMPVPGRYQGGMVDMTYHEDLARLAAKCRGIPHEECNPHDRMNREEHSCCIRIVMGMVKGTIPPEWGKESVRLLAARKVTAAELMEELASVA